MVANIVLIILSDEKEVEGVINLFLNTQPNFYVYDPVNLEFCSSLNLKKNLKFLLFPKLIFNRFSHKNCLLQHSNHFRFHKNQHFS